MLHDQLSYNETTGINSIATSYSLRNEKCGVVFEVEEKRRTPVRNTPTGNRTRVSPVAGVYAATIPPACDYVGVREYANIVVE